MCLHMHNNLKHTVLQLPGYDEYWMYSMGISVQSRVLLLELGGRFVWKAEPKQNHEKFVVAIICHCGQLKKLLS
jgi:hypothetical protein